MSATTRSSVSMMAQDALGLVDSAAVMPPCRLAPSALCTTRSPLGSRPARTAAARKCVVVVLPLVPDTMARCLPASRWGRACGSIFSITAPLIAVPDPRPSSREAVAARRPAAVATLSRTAPVLERFVVVSSVVMVGSRVVAAGDTRCWSPWDGPVSVVDPARRVYGGWRSGRGKRSGDCPVGGARFPSTDEVCRVGWGGWCAFSVHGRGLPRAGWWGGLFSDHGRVLPRAGRDGGGTDQLSRCGQRTSGHTKSPGP